MALVSQIVSGIILLGMFIYFVTHKPKKISVQTLTLVAIFIVLSIVLDRIAFVLPIFGVTGLKISLSQLPLMLIGAVFGPFFAFFSGVIYDGVALITNPTSFPFLGFTLNKVIVAMIPALIFYKKDSEKIGKSFPILLILMFILTNFVLFTSQSSEQLSLPIVGEQSMKWPLFLLLCILYLITYFSYKFIMKKVKTPEELSIIQKWGSALIGVEMTVQLILTPLWLSVMYNIPFFASVLLRQVKASVMLPLQLWLGFLLYQFIQHRLKQMR